MLILMRRLGEELRIGNDVIVKIVNVIGSQVTVGVTAPREVRVHREEVYERIRTQQQKSEALPSEPQLPTDG